MRANKELLFPCCAGLRGKLPDSIALPASVTVPFGSFEEALKASANADVRKRLQTAVDAIPPTAAEPALAQCRSIVMEVRGLGQTSTLGHLKGVSNLHLRAVTPSWCGLCTRLDGHGAQLQSRLGCTDSLINRCMDGQLSFLSC